MPIDLCGAKLVKVFGVCNMLVPVLNRNFARSSVEWRVYYRRCAGMYLFSKREFVAGGLNSYAGGLAYRHQG